MAPNILLLGASGFIGGTTLDTLIQIHPSYSVTALVRTPYQASTLKASYPNANLTTVIGSLTTPGSLTREASKASIILQLANGDHEDGTTALLNASVSSSHPHSTKGGKRYYIHLSGAANLLDLTLPPGSPASRSYTDTTDLPLISAFPHT